jgi:hypothetical protein
MRLAAMRRPTLLLLTALAMAGGALHAQTTGRGPTGQLFYPAKDQSPQQAERDKFECHEWAKQQSGFDPAALQAQPAPQQARSGPSTGDMVAGAAGGAAVAELADKNAGKGAAVGLLGAGLRQQVQQNKQLSAQQQQALQQQTAAAQKRSTYDRGFAACMEARGYSVK